MALVQPVVCITLHGFPQYSTDGKPGRRDTFGSRRIEDSRNFADHDCRTRDIWFERVLFCLVGVQMSGRDVFGSWRLVDQ